MLGDMFFQLQYHCFILLGWSGTHFAIFCQEMASTEAKLFISIQALFGWSGTSRV